MHCKTAFFLALIFLALPGVASGSTYGLCDSSSLDSNTGTLECNITQQKYAFTQQDIDNFWQLLSQDANFSGGKVKQVNWNLTGAVIQVGGSVQFVEPLGVSLPWDLNMNGDVNITYDVNHINPKGTTQTAIKKSIGGMQEHEISFKAAGGRRTVRNIFMRNPKNYSVYISGSTIKRMQIEIDGNIDLSNSFIENAGTIKAKNIILDDKSFIKNAEKIEAESLAVKDASYITLVGKPGADAIVLTGGGTSLLLSGNGYIKDLLGGIAAESDIMLEQGSEIITQRLMKEETIERISARNLTVRDSSRIVGLGGPSGGILLAGALSIDINSTIIGRGDNRPQSVEADSIEINGQSILQNFSSEIRVTGKQKFDVNGGSEIKGFSGKIESCAPIMLDGNGTRIVFDAGAQRVIKAPKIDVNNGAAIECQGIPGCDYNFSAQICGIPPTARLGIKGSESGIMPFAAEFNGACESKSGQVGCSINFGDGSQPEEFRESTAHTYTKAGLFKAILTATGANGEKATAFRQIKVADGNGTIPGTNEVFVGMTVSTEDVGKGDGISLIVSMGADVNSFLLENDLGLPPATAIPASFPAQFGPFTVGEGVSEGTHSFTVSGATKNGQQFRKSISFNVSSGEPILPPEEPAFSLPLELLALIGIIMLEMIVILVLLLKRKKAWPAAVQQKPQPMQQPWQRRWQPQMPVEQKPAQQEPAPAKPAEQEPPKPKGRQPPAAPPSSGTKGGEELPPWLKETTDEEE